MGGIVASKDANRLPITQGLREWEARSRREAERGVGQGKVETAAIFDSNGNPVTAYLGDRHSVAFEPRMLNVQGATFTHLHPDNNFGGTLSLQDLKVFARSQWSELRASSKQGQLYSIKAGNNVNREGLRKWINSNEKLLQKNFSNSYKSALKNATTVLKSGPNKGKVKLNQPNGTVKYVNPMTKEQVASYARQYSVGLFDRAYRKNLAKFGITYTSTKAGKNQ